MRDIARTAIVAAGVVMAVGGCRAGGARLFVALGGDDRNPGTKDSPLATLAGARDAVRQLRNARPNEDIVVVIGGGTYQPAETVVFGLADSAGKGRRIVYQAAQGERPVFSAAVAIRGWKKLTKALPGLPARAQPEVWMANVPAAKGSKWGFRTLWSGERRLPRARSKGFVLRSVEGRRGQAHSTLHFPPGALKKWPNLQDVEIVLRPTHQWVMNYLPLKSVDVASGTAETAIPGTYPLRRCHQDPMCYVENVPEALDEPGEWVLDTKAGRLYLWALGERPGEIVVAPRLRELVRVEGKVNFAGPKDEPVRGLVFKGLTFTRGDRDAWRADDAGLQHDWDMYDKANALLRFRGAEDCVVEGCRFVDSGGGGVRLDLHCRRIRVVGNEIARLGGTGVLLCGYGPGTKDVNKQNEVSNNWIHHCGRLYRHSPGIFVWQSGENRIAHNLIHNLPYTGIVVSGVRWFARRDRRECFRTIRWHELGGGAKAAPSWPKTVPYLHARNNVIEHNDIFAVMEEMGDGDGIYISGAGRGNVIRRNFVHHLIQPVWQAGVRTDDLISGTRVAENVVYRCVRGGLALKHVNTFENNFVVELYDPGPAGLPLRSYVTMSRGPSKGSRIQRNIFYHVGRAPAFYDNTPMGGRKQWLAPLAAIGADHNLFYATGDPGGARRKLAEYRKQGADAHSIVADPKFVDPAGGDFRFESGSPAPKLGIKGLDMRDCGPTAPWRQRLLGGQQMRTRILPDGGVARLKGPTTVTISCSEKGADIRYETDGGEPTRRSRKYTGAFALPTPLVDPSIVRAKAFKPGRIDVYGAVAFFVSPLPINDDFESTTVGLPVRRARGYWSGSGASIGVTDEAAAGGKRSVKIVDSAEAKPAFNPHFHYLVRLSRGLARMRFDIRPEGEATFVHEWRHYASGRPYVAGPSLTIRSSSLHVGGKELATIPTGRWTRIEVSAPLGAAASGKWRLTVTTAGKQRRTFTNLPCNAAFKELTWVGFSSPATRRTVFYLDNLRLSPLLR